MDRGRRPNKSISNRDKIYMDFKDIIKEHALPFLPAKSLFRFKGVCRDWKLQISTPFFAHSQSNSFHGVSGFFCQSCSAPPTFCSLDPNSYAVPDPSLKFLPEPVYIRTSSNGLLCCQGRAGDKAYYICNPVTKQWKKLPKPNANHGSDPAIVLVFEPSLLNFVAEYKLVCAFPSADFDNACEFEIYSSAEQSWKISGEIYFGAANVMPSSGVHANGIVYWQTKNRGIVIFDLTMERSQVLYSHVVLYSSLGVMNGKLTLTYARNQELKVSVLSNPYTNTMEMKSRVNAWDTKLQVHIDKSPEVAGCGASSTDQIAVLFASGNVILFRKGREIHSYDLKTNEFRLLNVEIDNDTKIVGYVNSLVEV